MRTVHVIAAGAAFLLVSCRSPDRGDAGPGAAIHVAIADGDAQRAAPSSAVSVAPKVLVTDSAGRAVPGAIVACAVGSGGGAIAATQARTDAAGIASCGTWTLGATLGVQRLTVGIEAGAVVEFWAAAVRSSGGITITVTTPAAGTRVHGTVGLAASVSSVYELARVEASIGAGPEPLVRSSGSAWGGSLSSAGVPSGKAWIVLTAIDVLGNVADQVVPLILDQFPVVAIASPRVPDLARPRVTVAASCQDDGAEGCVAMWLWVADGAGVSARLLEGAQALAGEVDLTPWKGREVTLEFFGVDPAGQVALERVPVFVDDTPQLRLLARVPGTVLDVLGTRILYLDPGGATTPAIVVQDATTGARETVTSVPGITVANTSARLSSSGVVYSIAGAVHRWRAGADAQLGTLAGAFDVAGDHAILPLVGAGGTGTHALVLADLDAASLTTVSEQPYYGADVTDAGAVAFATGGSLLTGWSVWLWRSGTATAIAQGNSGSSGDPVTDGVNVLYCLSQSREHELFVHDGLAATSLGRLRSDWPDCGRHAVSGGWIAYEAVSELRNWQVRRRRALDDAPVTFFAGDSVLEGVGPDGTIILRSSGRRHRSSPGTALEDVGPSLGSVIERGGRFFVLYGPNVLELGP